MLLIHTYYTVQVVHTYYLYLITFLLTGTGTEANMRLRTQTGGG